MLVEAGADANDNNCDVSNLYYAASRDMVEMVQLLLNYGANSKLIINKQKTTLLMVAAECANVECIRILINHGADVNEKDGKKRNTLYYAAAGGKLENALELINNGATFNSAYSSPLPYSSSLEMFTFFFVLEQMLMASLNYLMQLCMIMKKWWKNY